MGANQHHTIKNITQIASAISAARILSQQSVQPPFL